MPYIVIGVLSPRLIILLEYVADPAFILIPYTLPATWDARLFPGVERDKP